MNSMFEDVIEFHCKVLGVAPSATPSLVSEEFIMEKFRFLAEENEEFYNAAHAGDIVGAVDGLLDTIYVALGALYSMGIPADQCWQLVHAANMRKVRGETKRGNKVDATKPEGWVGPEAGIAAILGRIIDENNNP